MTALRPFGYLLLILALIGNGLVPGGMVMAQALASTPVPEMSAQDAPGGCHDAAETTAAAEDQERLGTPMKCCDGTSCTCACLQLAPAVLLTFALPDLERFSPPPVLGTLVTWPSAPSTPQLRPPIA